jgi:hypothetical protein
MLPDALDFLDQATEIMETRAKERGHTTTENTFQQIADTFNAMTFNELSAKDVAVFMLVLKLVRHYNGVTYKHDDFVDAIAYAAFAGQEAAYEAEGTELQQPTHTIQADDCEEMPKDVARFLALLMNRS